ncbi:MAG: transcriptional regulator [Bacillales bacterium]|nr:transcriptional regulator [Bacillales bacterium]
MKNKIILVDSNQLGKGDEGLGEVLIETFFTLLKQREVKPHAVFLLNSGVQLATDESLVSVHLKELANSGVEILACTTCLNHYHLMEKLVVGSASTMGKFIDLAESYEIITL